MKHADRLGARTTGESQLQVCYKGDAPDRTLEHLPRGKPIKVRPPGGRRPFGRAGPGRVCGVLPVLHHAPWAKHTGKGRENHNPTCVAGRVRSGLSHRAEKSQVFFSSTEVKREMEQRVTREADAARQEGKNGLLGSSVVRHPNAQRRQWREFWCAWLCSWALVAGPRRVHLKPKVHSSTLVFLFLERAVPCHLHKKFVH